MAVARAPHTFHTAPVMAAIAGTARGGGMPQEILKGKTPATIEVYFAPGDRTGAIGTYQPGGPTTTSDNGFFFDGYHQQRTHLLHLPPAAERLGFESTGDPGAASDPGWRMRQVCDRSVFSRHAPEHWLRRTGQTVVKQRKRIEQRGL